MQRANFQAIFIMGLLATGCVSEVGDDWGDSPDGSEQLGEALRPSGPRCSIEPNPALTGEAYMANVAGLSAGESYEIAITDPDSSQRQSVIADGAGTIALEGSSARTGSGEMVVYGRRRGRLRSLARCTFTVVDASGCAPRTCADAGAQCGSVDDGCGGTLSCGSCASGTSCNGNVCEPNTGSDGWPSDWARFEEEVLRLVNQHRAAGATCGTTAYAPAPPLTMNSQLRTAARLHSEDMGRQGYFSHTSLDGRSFFDRMIESGWVGACPCGENIGAGYSSASAVVTGWMNSPGHCANIMGRSYQATGIGYSYVAGSRYGAYWTQNFAAR